MEMIFSTREKDNIFIMCNEICLLDKGDNVEFLNATGATFSLKGGLPGISQKLVFYSALIGVWVRK